MLVVKIHTVCISGFVLLSVVSSRSAGMWERAELFGDRFVVVVAFFSLEYASLVFF